MDSKLFRLFDYQKFMGNRDLQRIIDDAHARCAARSLSLDEMEWVNAAGQPEMVRKAEEKDR